MKRAKSDWLMVGRIFDDRSNRITPEHGLQKGKEVPLLSSSPLIQGQLSWPAQYGVSRRQKLKQ